MCILRKGNTSYEIEKINKTHCLPILHLNLTFNLIAFRVNIFRRIWLFHSKAITEPVKRCKLTRFFGVNDDKDLKYLLTFILAVNSIEFLKLQSINLTAEQYGKIIPYCFAITDFRQDIPLDHITCKNSTWDASTFNACMWKSIVNNIVLCTRKTSSASNKNTMTRRDIFNLTVFAMFPQWWSKR